MLNILAKSDKIYTDIIMEDKKLTRKIKPSKVLSILFIVLVLIGLIIYILNEDGIESINNILNEADYRWILAGLICVIIECLAEALVFHMPLKKIYPKHKYSLSLKSNIIGKLFNNITPFSSGGQALQAYMLSRYGLRVSDTLSVLMMKFVVYQVGLFSYALILLLTNLDFFNITFGNYIWIVVLGFIMNLIATVFIFIAGINKNIILKISQPLIKLMSKIRFGKYYLIKDVEATIQKFNESVSNYNIQFKKMKNQKPILIKMYVVQMIQFLAYFSIPFMIYKSFGNSGVQYIQILLVQTYLLLVMSFIPTPGSGLGAEGGFALFYKTIFVTGLNLAILFWRIYTFYLPIIVGVIVLIFMNKRKTKLEGD